MKTWALIPARGGSKSIPLKNLVPLAGMPLLDYSARAAQAAGCFDRILCSTDDDRIKERCRVLGVEVDHRPEDLCGDDVPVAAVARELLQRVSDAPEAIVLVQPTSPFLRADHILQLLDAMARSPEAQSGQTITPCPHNFHAWNQREFEAGQVRFKFAAERQTAYNKQKKPKLFVFGNLVAARSAALLGGACFFAEPSVGIEVPYPYNFDLDTQADRALAEAFLAGGLIELPHMRGYS